MTCSGRLPCHVVGTVLCFNITIFRPPPIAVRIQDAGFDAPAMRVTLSVAGFMVDVAGVDAPAKGATQ
jgi:hypothetical protein